MKHFEYNGYNIKLGENAAENHSLVELSCSNYTWIHLKSFPSGHVVIDCKSPDKNTIQYAANICLQGTKQKNLKDIYVSITNISNLLTTDKIGQVEFKSNKKVKKIKIDT